MLAVPGWAFAGQPLLIRHPTVSVDKIAFCYASDIWTVGRDGGDAQRLTAGVGIKCDPYFSPDGKWIAFTADYYGHRDVFVIPTAGGEPKRLTWHPAGSAAAGWTPDSKNVLFASTRTSSTDPPKLFTVPVEGGFASELPLPMGSGGAFSTDGSKIAYTPRFQWQAAWKGYRGGQTMAIWIASLANSHVEKIPRENSNDFDPLWSGNKVYFLSDRSGPVSLFVYDTETKKVSEAVKNGGLDFKSACAGGNAIVWEQFGSLHLLDTRTGKAKAIDVRVPGSSPRCCRISKSCRPTAF
jgi:tricorn protease